MTFSEWWSRLVLKKAKLLDDDATVEIKVEQFKKLLRSAYDAGYASQQGSKEPIFGDIFGWLDSKRKG